MRGYIYIGWLILLKNNQKKKNQRLNLTGGWEWLNLIKI